MYSKKTSIVLGFHGCDISVRNAVVNGENLIPSCNSYDWLGHGIYFWESDPQRALEFAIESSKRKNSKIKTPAVLGAVLDLGRCLDLTNRNAIATVKSGYEWLKDRVDVMPINKNVGSDKDLLLRVLDCAVIQAVHAMCELDEMTPYDSVRGMFTEGKEAYPGAGFMEETHTQICITNPNCIKGYFLPRQKDKNYPMP